MEEIESHKKPFTRKEHIVCTIEDECGKYIFITSHGSIYIDDKLAFVGRVYLSPSDIDWLNKYPKYPISSGSRKRRNIQTIFRNMIKFIDNFTLSDMEYLIGYDECDEDISNKKLLEIFTGKCQVKTCVK
jgi:hypothetical protein